MAAYQNLIDNIRSVCNATDQTPTPELADWAGQYADLCRDANERLRRCADLLQRGLRGEALHLANQMPPLLDVVAALDFQEAPIWESLCAAHSLPRPSKLSIELAGQLNESYAAHQPIEAMLRLHRIASIAPAPLPDRMSILRELIKLDAAAQSWPLDLQGLEKTRLRDVRADVQRAIKQADLGQLQVLDREIDETKWTVPVPDDLRLIVQSAQREFRQREGIATLKTMLPALNDAYSAMAFDEAAPLVDQWASTVTRYGVVLPPELSEAAGPIEAWVQDERDRRLRQEQFEHDCSRLDQLLQDDSIATSVFAQTMRTLRGSGSVVPESLERRYRSTIGQREMAASRRKRRNTAIMALAAVALIAGVAITGIKIYHRQEAGKFARQIENLTDAGKLAEAQAAVNEAAAAGYAHVGTVVDATTMLTTAQTAEQTRTEKLAAEVSKIQALVQSRDPKIDFAVVDKLVRTGEEKLKVLDLKDARNAINRELAQGQMTLAQERLGKLAEMVKAADAALASGDLQAVRDSKRAADEVLVLLWGMKNVASDVGVATQALQQRLDIVISSAQQQEKSAEAMVRLRRAARSADDLATQLVKAGESFGSPARAAVFAETAKLASHWRAVEAWAGISSRVRDAVKAADLRALIKARDEAAGHLEANPGSPHRADVVGTIAYVNAAIQCADSSSEWRKALIATLESRPMSGWLQVRTKTGTFFVADQDSVTASATNGQLDRLRVTYIVGETADPERPATKEATIATNDLLDPTKDKPEKTDQQELALGLLRELDQTDLGNWDSLHARMTKTIIQKANVNAGLRGVLMQVILDSQTSESLSMVATVTRAREALLRLRASESAWMNPLDDRATLVRDRCQTWLADAKELPAQLSEMSALRRQQFERGLLQITTTGVLLSDGAGVTIQFETTPSDGVVYGVAPSTQGTTAWIPIATLAKGAIKIDDKAKQISDGSMIFVVASPTNTN